ncbi:MAG: ASKHA domain-containing protein [Planctomycetota bacterium]|nr:ASKHA domain-containing protein [Planctomycetota bacterium]
MFRIVEDTTVEIPQATRPYGERILAEGKGFAAFSGSALVRQHYRKFDPPSREDGVGDFERLKLALGSAGRGLTADLLVLRALPGVLRESGFEITATCAGSRLLAVEGGDRRGTAYGLAFDLGTTTVVGYLVDLVRGRTLAVASRSNPQAVLGQDVIARAQHAGQGEAERRELRTPIVDCLQAIAAECAAQADVPLERCFDVAIGGNTIMLHLLLGVNPHPITVVPFAPAWTGARELAAADLGLAIHPLARAYLLPCVAGYVGGDITAGLLATGLCEGEELTLFVDIGTNGEVVLGNREGWLACAAPAGPAFEGARISCGMTAMSGAIDAVTYVPDAADLELHVLGDAPPRGMCGTGLIDGVAAFLETGMIDELGRIVSLAEARSRLPPKLAARIQFGEKGARIVLVPAERTSDRRRDLCLTQRDIRELQLAKGAIRAAVDMVLKLRGVAPDAVKRVLIAGGFGSFVRPASARAIGLFPASFTEGRMEFVGNTAGLGACFCLAHLEARSRIEKLARQTDYVELSAQPDFTTVFSEAMVFPEPEDLIQKSERIRSDTTGS